MRTSSRLALAGAFILMLAGPAAAQYPDVAAVTVSDTTLACPGDDLTLSGSGFLPGEEIDIFFDGQAIATLEADDEGEFTATITAPDAAAGQHTVEAVGETSGSDAAATVTCVAGAAVAFTGANITWGVVLLAALLVVGASALIAGRRRAGSVA